VGTAAELHRPRGLTSDGTSVYWVEFKAHTSRQGVIATGEVTTLAGDPCNPIGSCQNFIDDVGSAARFDGPFTIAYHYPPHALFVHDSANLAVRRIR